MLEGIDSYIYTGLSFSTFSFDEASLLCLKYELSRFRKKKYLKKLKEVLLTNPNNCLDANTINYYVHSVIKSINDTTLFLTTNPKIIKLLKKFLKKDVSYSSYFKIIDLSEEIKMKKACFMIPKRSDLDKYSYLISYFKNYEVVYLEDMVNEIQEATCIDTIFDKIKLSMLKDNDSEIYFIRFDMYSNIASSYAYDLNKIAIVL